MTNDSSERNWSMRTKLMMSALMLTLPAGAMAQETTQPTEGAVPSAEQAQTQVPPAPQGPFFSRGLVGQDGTNMPGFPPLGFDPMTGVAPTAPAAPGEGVSPPAPAPVYPGPAHPGNRFAQDMANTLANTLGGDAEVDIHVRGRTALGGTGRGGQGWGPNFMHGVPYGMPYGQGYGAPYGTPFNTYAPGMPQQPQYPPQPVPGAAPGAAMPGNPATAPGVNAVPQAPAQMPTQIPAPQAPVPQAQAPQASVPQTQAQPTTPQASQQNPGGFSWMPKNFTIPNPGNFFSQGSQAPAQSHVQPQAPAQPSEPDWVKQQREAAEKRQAEAQKRLTEMQQRQGSVYGRGFAPQGQPFGQGYGAPYGAPYGTPFGYAPQAPAPAQNAAPTADDKK